MNYSQALRGPLTRSVKIQEIHLAGETEIGRKMTDVEIDAILTKFSPNSTYDYLQKVNHSYKKLNVIKTFSMVMEQLGFCFFFPRGHV